MLKNTNNNKLAIRVKKILDGCLKYDTYNLRMCFYGPVKNEYDELKSCLEEIKQLKISDDFIKECAKEFNEKITIYERYFKLLEEREKNEEK